MGLVFRGVAQFGSALDWGSRGRWFKSSRPDFSVEGWKNRAGGHYSSYVWKHGLRKIGFLGRLAQLARAPALQAGGRWFKSSTAHFFALL